VAPADIQVFNKETKEKLRARCHGGKTVKFFAQAVEQICTVFHEKQNKSNRPSPSNYANKPIDHEINYPNSASNLVSTSSMEVEFRERTLKANDVTSGKHIGKPKLEAKPESSEKQKDDSLSFSASFPDSMSNLIPPVTNTEDEISKLSKNEKDKEIVKMKANEVGDVVIALEASRNSKRGRDISATGEGFSMQPRKKTAREVKSNDSSEKGVSLSKKHLNESTPESKSMDLSEGSLLMKSKGLNVKSATLSREVLQVNMKGKKDDDLTEKGLNVNDEDTGRIRGKTLFKKGPEATAEALSRKVSKTNTEASHKTKISVKPQGSSENGTNEENVNVPKEISRINNVPLEEKVQEPKMRGLSERKREMEGSVKKKLSSSGPAVKKHQLGAEETPPALKGSNFFDRSVPSGEIFGLETKLDAHASEKSDRKKGLAKRSCLFNEEDESEGKKTPVHRKAPDKLENQKKVTLSPQQVKMPEKRVEKFELREHGDMHVNLERTTGSLFTVKSTQERIRVKTKPTHEKDSFLADR
jgi:hypothetical protein